MFLINNIDYIDTYYIILNLKDPNVFVFIFNCDRRIFFLILNYVHLIYSNNNIRMYSMIFEKSYNIYNICSPFIPFGMFFK